MLQLSEFEVDTLNDVGAERNFLACIIKSEEAYLGIPQHFAGDAFYFDSNRMLWQAIDGLYSHGNAIDPVVLHESLSAEGKKELDALGGWKYINALKDIPLDPRNITKYTERLLELRTRRRIQDAGETIAGLAVDKEPVPAIRERIELAISEIDGSDMGEVSQIGDGGFEYLQKKMANPEEVPGLSSGFTGLDRLLQGFQSGRLYVVGARKKTGKSILLLNWAHFMAVEWNIPVLWISTEHTRDDEYSRLLSLTSQVPEMAINNGTFTEMPVLRDRVIGAHERIKTSPFYFDSMPFFSLDKIKRVTRKYVRVHGIKALFFDYIKNPENTANQKEWQELGVLSFGLKSLAASEQIPVITAAQVNREGAQYFRAEGEIDSDFFAGSDRIAQALSVGMVLREPNNKEMDGDKRGFKILKVTDNRHGPDSYSRLLRFDGSVITMRELDD